MRGWVLCGIFCVTTAAGARDVQSLAGTWEIAFDHHDVGVKEGWHQADVFGALGQRRPIAVPSCWELLEKDYEGVAYYRHTFAVPAAWAKKVVQLQFDAVNFKTEVWLNGEKLGMHEGGFTPFSFRIEKVMKAEAENTLMLRVAGPVLLKNKTVDGMGPMETPQWRGAITGGVWQPVRLIATGAVYVKDVFIEPKIGDNSAAFNLQLEGAGAGTESIEVTTTIRPAKEPDKVVATSRQTVQVKRGTTQQRYQIVIPGARHWSVDDPHLYRVAIDLHRDGQRTDRWTTRFGLREFTVRNNRFYLNNKPLYLKATFFEGLYPTKLAYPDSREMMVREIRLAKEAGFNMIRPWRKPAPPVWLDLADEMGVLVVGSMAIECMDMPRASDRLQGWVENEVRQTVLRDRNRTCIVQWELFNELKRPILKEMLKPMVALTRKLDPTRVILDESGGWAHGANLFLPYESEPFKFNDIHHYPGFQINDQKYSKLMLTGRPRAELNALGIRGGMPGRNVVPGIMTFFSELGYGSLPDLVTNNRQFKEKGNPIAPPTIYHQRLADEHRAVLLESGFNKVFPDLQRFCLDQQAIHGRANKRMIEAVRCNPRVAGYCVHALTGGDWIMGAGLLDLWRNPKTYAFEGTQAANRPRLACIRVRPRNVYAEKGTQLVITGVNELAALNGRLRIDVVDKKGKAVLRKEKTIELGQGIVPLFAEALDTAAWDGTYTVKVQITDEIGQVVAQNRYDFDVFAAKRLPAPKTRIAVMEQRNALKPFLKASGIVFEDFGPKTDRSAPVFVSHTQAGTPALQKQYDELKAFVRSGGTVVYLQGAGPKVPWGKQVKAPPLLPVAVDIKAATGLWLGISHVVHDHPIFAGLPVNGMMGPIYENVWANGTLVVPA